MNNNKKILKRSSAAFLAALNIFNFAGGSSKALDPLDVLLNGSKEPASNDEVENFEKLKSFLDSLESINFDELLNSDNLLGKSGKSGKDFAGFYKLKEEFCFIDFINNEFKDNEIKDTVISKVGEFESINSEFVVYKIREGAAATKKSAIEKALNADENIIFINVDNIEYLKSWCKTLEEKKKLEEEKENAVNEANVAKNTAEEKLMQAQRDLEAEKANVQKANEEKEQLKKKAEEEKEKLEEEKENLKKEKKDAEDAKQKSEEEKKKLETEKNKAEEEKEQLEKENEKFTMYAYVNKVLKSLVGCLQKQLDDTKFEETVDCLKEVEKDIDFEDAKFKLVGEDDENFLGKFKFKFKHNEKGETFSINGLIDSLFGSKLTEEDEITKFEPIKLDDIKKTVVKEGGKEDTLNIEVYKEKLKRYIDRLNKIIETISLMPGFKKFETFESNENMCKNKAKTIFDKLDKISGLSGTLEEQLDSIGQGVDDFKKAKETAETAKNDLDTKLKTANSRARKLGVTAVLGWVGTLVSLGCVFQNELKNACGTVYKKVSELKNSILG